MSELNVAELPGWAQVGSRDLLRDELDDADYDTLAEVVDHATELLGETCTVALEDLIDFRSASAALQAVWKAIVGALRQGGRSAELVMGARSLSELLVRVGSTERAVAQAERSYKDARAGRAREALGAIQQMTSVSQLIAEAPRAICGIGFDRTLISSIEYSTWLTDAAHIEDDPGWAQHIVDTGRAAPQPVIPGLPETDIVRFHKPIVVNRADERGDVHKAVVRAAAGRSYVAAPIMPRARVVGFLHCDRIFHRGDVDEFDSQMLGIFAQGYSFAIERAITLRDLDELRTHVRGFTQGIESFVRSTTTSPGFHLDGRQVTGDAGHSGATELSSRTEGFSQGAGGVTQRPLHMVLTRRELEVLSLLAEGDNNQRIAKRLVISDETVKSHVKSIMRKLGVSNRIEAVARWHRSMSTH